MSDLWSHLLDMIGAKAAHTTAYHPQANGIIKQFHQQLKASLKAKQNTSNWFNELPLVLLGIRATLKEDIGCSAAEMVYGQTLRLPGEYFLPPPDTPQPHAFLSHLKSDMAILRPTPTKNHISNRAFHIPRNVMECTHVFVHLDYHCFPLDWSYSGP